MLEIIDPAKLTAPPGTVMNPFCHRQPRHVQSWFLLTCLAVAGKNADVQQGKINQMKELIGTKGCPLYWLETETLRGRPERADEVVRRVKLGQYTRFVRAWRRLSEAYWDPMTQWSMTLEEVEAMCGPKTARMFMMYSGRNKQVAVLDTHILRFLRAVGRRGIPKATPAAGSAAYARAERAMLREAKERGVCPAILDFSVWLHSKQGKPWPTR